MNKINKKNCDLFTIDDFIEAVDCAMIMDDDGFGYLSKDGKTYDNVIEVCCCLPILESNKRAGYTHVVWYNR